MYLSIICSLIILIIHFSHQHVQSTESQYNDNTIETTSSPPSHHHASQFIANSLHNLSLSTVYQSYSPPPPVNYSNFIPDHYLNLLPQNSPLLSSSSSFPSSRCAIIGFGVTYNYRELYIFTVTARSSCTECNIIIFINTTQMMNYDLQELFINYNIIHIDVTPYLTPAISRYYISQQRYFVILEYLLTNELYLRYDAIFLSDTRDVAFQRNIFHLLKNQQQQHYRQTNSQSSSSSSSSSSSYPEVIYGFQESQVYRIGTCDTNSIWIKNCFGEEKLQQFYNHNIICSGTILGTTNAILYYLSLFISTLTSNTTTSHCPYIPGSDQGIHNKILYDNDLSQYNISTYIYSHESGPILTLNHSPTFMINQFGLLLNEYAQLAYVIHQYDRSPSLVMLFNQKYTLITPGIYNTRAMT